MYARSNITKAPRGASLLTFLLLCLALAVVLGGLMLLVKHQKNASPWKAASSTTAACEGAPNRLVIHLIDGSPKSSGPASKAGTATGWNIQPKPGQVVVGVVMRWSDADGKLGTPQGYRLKSGKATTSLPVAPSGFRPGQAEWCTKPAS